MVRQYPETKEQFKIMWPEVPNSELKVYDLLSKLSDDWHVWHSFDWFDRRSNVNKESDVILLNKKRGFLVLEVKGGDISVEDGKFYSKGLSKDKKTSETYSIKNPFTQASDAMFVLFKAYISYAKVQPNSKTLLQKKDFNYRFPGQFSFGVIFPDSNFKAYLDDDIDYLGFETKKIFDLGDFTEEKEFQKAKKKKSKQSNSPLESYLLNLFKDPDKVMPNREAIFTAFINVMQPSIAIKFYYNEYLEEINKALEKANEVQDYLIDSLTHKQDLAIEGSAGSGKTFVAMKKAMRILEKRKKVLFLCYNRKLKFFVIDQTKLMENKLQILDQGEDIEEYISFYNIYEFIGSFGRSLPDGENKTILLKANTEFEDEIISQTLKKILKERNISEEFKFDAILIDEAQDIDNKILPFFKKFLKDPYECFYIFYDKAQRIFDKPMDLDALGFEQSRDLVVLNKNLRNTEDISEYIEENIKLGHYKHFSGVRALRVKTSKNKTIEEALQNIIDEIISTYAEYDLNLSKLIILSTHRIQTLLKKSECKVTSSYDNSQIVKFVGTKSGKKVLIIFPTNQNSFENVVNVNPGYDFYLEFTTVRAFKGLEREIVFMLYNEAEFNEGDGRDDAETMKMQYYVGMTRAKFILHVVEYMEPRVLHD